MNSSIRLLLTVTCSAGLIGAAITGADAKSLGQGRDVSKPQGVAQPVSPPVVREHTGSAPPKGFSAVPPKIVCHPGQSSCRGYSDGRWITIDRPTVRDHRNPAPKNNVQR